MMQIFRVVSQSRL